MRTAEGDAGLTFNTSNELSEDPVVAFFSNKVEDTASSLELEVLTLIYTPPLEPGYGAQEV